MQFSADFEEKTGICFIFNHPYPAQIPVIKSIFKERFSNILFLIPFYRDDSDSDVFTVYRGAFSFDGMIVEAREKIKETFKDCSHVLFVHNDLLLSGQYRETTAASLLGIGGDQKCYLSNIWKINGSVHSWSWANRLGFRIRIPMHGLMGTGAERVFEYLPNFDDVAEKCVQAGYDPAPSTLRRDKENISKESYYGFVDHELFETHQSLLSPDGTLSLGRPYFGGYSDIVCVPYQGLNEWLHLLGILSSMEIFAEISIPTSLVWTFGKISTSHSANISTSILWGTEQRRQTDDIGWVKERFAKGDHYIHPVKYEKYNEEDYKALAMTV